MAGLRRAQEIDQWRPEESPAGDRHRERVRDRIVEPGAASPVPRTARDSRRGHPHDTGTRSSTRHVRGRSDERSLSRDRVRRRSRGGSREDHRPTRRAPSANRATHTHRHRSHAHHHRESTPSAKRPHSRSPSPHSHKRSRRHRSRSTVRSKSRTRRAETTHRATSRAFSPRSDRDRTRRHTPEIDTYKPAPSARRRSPSADSYYRPASSRGRKRSPTPERKPRRELSRRRESPRRPHRRDFSPLDDTREKRHAHSSAKDRRRSPSRSPPVHTRSRSPRRRRSPSPKGKSSPRASRREKEHSRKSRSPRAPRHRTSRSRSREAERPSNRDSHPPSRRGSPLPPTSDEEGDSKMRGGAYYQGRGGPQHSYSPPHSHQYPSQGHPGGRGAWSGHQSYPSQRSVSHRYPHRLWSTPSQNAARCVNVTGSLLTPPVLPRTGTHPINHPTTRTTPQTKPNLVTRVPPTAVAFEVATTDPTGGLLDLLSPQSVDADVVLLPHSSRTCLGRLLLVHEVVVRLLKRHAIQAVPLRNQQQVLQQQPMLRLPQWTLMTIRSGRRRISVLKMKERKKIRRCHRQRKPRQRHRNRDLVSHSRRRLAKQS
jgi:hypothetical protein